jgi:hypothetical protein
MRLSVELFDDETEATDFSERFLVSCVVRNDGRFLVKYDPATEYDPNDDPPPGTDSLP